MPRLSADESLSTKLKRTCFKGTMAEITKRYKSQQISSIVFAITLEFIKTDGH